jgi:uncharacterized protein DUF4384
MKRWIGTFFLLAGLVPAVGRADPDSDWDDWYDGDVEVRLQVTRGEGAVYAPGEPVWAAFETNADAYVLVLGIDTEGIVHVLFPRWWEADGWVPEGEHVELHAADLAWPPNGWGSAGIVYMEAVASPVPFDYRNVGLALRHGRGSWIVDGRPLRVSGDPFLAFNDIHRRLFPDWEQAVFTVDYTWFYVGAECASPRYLGYVYDPVYLPASNSWNVSVRFGWNWQFGYGYCRPVYAGYYVPGRPIAYTHVHYYYVAPGCADPYYGDTYDRRTGGSRWWGGRYVASAGSDHERRIRGDWEPADRHRERDGEVRRRLPAERTFRQPLPPDVARDDGSVQPWRGDPDGRRSRGMAATVHEAMQRTRTGRGAEPMQAEPPQRVREGVGAERARTSVSVPRPTTDSERRSPILDRVRSDLRKESRSPSAVETKRERDRSAVPRKSSKSGDAKQSDDDAKQSDDAKKSDRKRGAGD